MYYIYLVPEDGGDDSRLVTPGSNNFSIFPVLPISETIIAKQPPSYLLPAAIRPAPFLRIEIQPVNFPLGMHYTTTTVTGILVEYFISRPIEPKINSGERKIKETRAKIT